MSNYPKPQRHETVSTGEEYDESTAVTVATVVSELEKMIDELNNALEMQRQELLPILVDDIEPYDETAYVPSEVRSRSPLAMHIENIKVRVGAMISATRVTTQRIDL